jgi:3-deoxy-D-manno-octulosonic-acid transferase
MNRTLYTLLLYLLLPFTPLKLLWRGRKQAEYLTHWQERYGFYRQPIQQQLIWLHCVSVGETRAAEPLVKALFRQYPQRQILLTHTTPTGRATSQQLFADKVQSVYLPYDVPCAVKRFLNHFQPSIGIIMETELWFNVIAACKQQHIPLLLVNARLSEKSAQGYAKLGKLVQQGLENLSAIAAQTEADAKRLQQLSASHVSVIGNLKFDVSPPEEAMSQGKKLRAILGELRPVFLAASTREGEESQILEAVAKANIPNLLTIIVPRHPQRFDAVADFLSTQQCQFVRRSQLDKTSSVADQISYVLGDSMGEMFTYYASCDIAFIGGSLLPLGGQNPIEAFSMGKPVLIGMHTFNFEQITNMAIVAGAALRVNDSSNLAQQLITLFADTEKRNAMASAALHFSKENQGATQRALMLIQQHLAS